MGNWNYKSSELAKRLSKDTIRNGGIEQINAPIINCHVASDLELMTVEMGGYPTLVNYNKDRERQHKKDVENKRLRSLKRQIKRFGGRKNGDELPSPETHLDSSRGNIK